MLYEVITIIDWGLSAKKLYLREQGRENFLRRPLRITSQPLLQPRPAKNLASIVPQLVYPVGGKTDKNFFVTRVKGVFTVRPVLIDTKSQPLARNNFV